MLKKKLEEIDFDLYDFDKDKGIWSKHWKRWLKGNKVKVKGSDSDYYLVVWLKNKDGKRAFYQYHRVMAYIFVQRPNKLKNVPYEDLEVNHINEIKHDNRASNLEWCDRVYNINYGNGNTMRSVTNKAVIHTKEWNEKVSEALSTPIIQVKDDGEIVRWDSIAKCGENGYTQSAVSQCCNNKFHPKCQNHRRYKHSEWYFEKDYLQKNLEGIATS